MMNKLSLKNRIALYSVLGIASLSFIVFIAIYFTVKNTVFNEIDKDLDFEGEKHLNELTYINDSVGFTDKNQWLEREHIEMQSFPLFIEIVDKNGKTLDKSPNLYEESLEFVLDSTKKFIHNQYLRGESTRQIQLPLVHEGKTYGFMAIAMSFEDSEMVIQSLLDTLLLIYPVLLVITFFTSRIISRITIKPISLIAKNVDEINSNNLNKRVSETNNGDELETLSKAVNDFLDRIDAAVKREKQFTANASHQLRTPLAVLKGNLEVLIRKARQPEVYVKEIEQNISKIDTMTDAVEKLLVLARLDREHQNITVEEVDIHKLTETILTNYKQEILDKSISLNLSIPAQVSLFTNKTYLSLILDNLISNAIRYADPSTKINIDFTSNKSKLTVSISNTGAQIPEEEREAIFNPFYRSQNHEFTEEGYGLGLAIVSKAAILLQIKLHLTSGATTIFSIDIPINSQT